MRPGDLVCVKESRHFPGKFELFSFPSFNGERKTHPLGTGVGIVLEIKCYDVFYGTGIHILTPCGHGWTNLDGVKKVR